MRNTITTALVLLSSATGALAQQAPLSSLYNVNRFFLNPANAGDQGNIAAYVGNRSQWRDITGGPNTAFLSVHAPVAKGSNLGMNLAYDKTDLLSTISGHLAYAYRLEFGGTQHWLSMGLGLGFMRTQLDLSSAVVEDPSDMLLSNGNLSGAMVDGIVGVTYHWKSLEVGINVPNVIGLGPTFDTKNKSYTMGTDRHYRMLLSYDYTIKNTWHVEPTVLLRYQPNVPFSFDAGVRGGYKEIAWLQFMWRHETGPVIAAGVKVAKKFTIAYAYDMAINGVSRMSPMSHEVMLGFNFGTGAEKKLKEFELRLDSLDAEQDSIDKRVNKLDTTVNTALDSMRQRNTMQDDEINRLDEQIRNMQKELEELNQKVDEGLDTNMIKGLLRQIKAMKDGKGNTTFEQELLESGYYVVIESFRSLDNAYKGIEIWQKKGREAIMVYDEERKWYYLYSKRFGTEKEARKEMRETRKLDVPDAWVHKYQVVTP
jgi:type IX secretion system PorP/SprF family membrane protein